MFKSVFQKIFFTYLLILVCIMLVLAVTLSALTDNYVYREKQNLLDNVAYKTNVLANKYASGDIDHAQLTEALDAMGYTTDTKIYIIKADISMLDQIELGGELVDSYLTDALHRVLAGETVLLRRQYSREFEEQVVFAAYPWENGDAVSGAVLLLSPEKTISAIVGDIRLVIGLAAAAFVFLGGLVIYFFARRFVAPIKAIDAASALMARGEVAMDIDIKTRDELGALARSFNSMKDKIQKNEQLRSELISNISHDLRTPITNINGFLSGMAEGVIKKKDYPRYIDIIRQEARRLTALTGEILQTAKIQSGTIELNITRFSLCQIVDAAVCANRPLADEKEIRIACDVPQDLAVGADQKKTEQALSNLINNAVKYAFPKSTVTVSAKITQNAVEVAVLDHGAVISGDDLPYIFDRFYRAPSAGPGGFGLGLCIAKTYVEAHGGTIHAKSSAEEGTLFTFTIPNA